MDSRRVIAVTFVGKQNEPLYFFCEEEYAELLHVQMISHSSLDIIEEKRKKSTGASAPQDMYLGYLISIDDYKTYGYYSNTHTKVIVVTEAATNESTMREFLTALYGMYVSAAQNPFQETGQVLLSRKFHSSIQQVVQRINVSNATKL